MREPVCLHTSTHAENLLPQGMYFLRNYVRSYPVLPQWHVKDPGHSAKSAGGRLHLNTHTSSLIRGSRSELTMPLSRHSGGNLSRNELTRTSRGNTRSQSSQLAEPLWTDPKATMPPRFYLRRTSFSSELAFCASLPLHFLSTQNIPSSSGPSPFFFLLQSLQLFKYFFF